ncbi:redoxin domain-containing protein [Marinifilum sp. N1E240]|uniref:thioredoxin family protein n=1 Tax=Marinifilum sp. N1E240 TaxID=2608082 RepID=UPI00128DFFAA|nr:thioredoxin family protein [Marinifilum sp. N1E240]MPQ46516.1 redoxin domain-containing protein [Marinifilum sp. N1E240]
MKKLLSIAFIMLSVLAIQAQGYKVGDTAFDFNLKNIDGKQVSLADYKDAKGFVVIFTCNHCPYAVAYEDRIIEIDKKYKKMGFPVIAINPNDPVIVLGDSFDGMKKRAEEKGFTFPYLFDAKQEVYKNFGATKTPHVYILSKKGTYLTVEYIGTIDNNYKDESKVSTRYVEDAIKALMNNKKPTVTYTKAIGCSIKTKG